MRNIRLESFLLLLPWQLFVIVGNAHPAVDLSNEEIAKNDMVQRGADISIHDTIVPSTIYTYDKVKENHDLKHMLAEKKKHKLSKSMKSNKIFYTHASRLEETDKHINTIIYEILRCVPPKLPFILPRCTAKDFANEKSSVQQLYPFGPDEISKVASISNA